MVFPTGYSGGLRMNGYEAEIEAIREASTAAHSAAKQGSAVQLVDGALQLAAALPGGRSAAAATALAGNWRDRLASWAGDMGNYSAKLESAADSYSVHENAVEADFRDITPSGGSRPV
jgi:Ser/Thr protein kinase RdoA (MazF antagonist)